MERLSVRGIGSRESGTPLFNYEPRSPVFVRRRMNHEIRRNYYRVSRIFLLYGDREPPIGLDSHGDHAAAAFCSRNRGTVRGTQPAIRIMQMISLYYTPRDGRFRFQTRRLLGTRSILPAFVSSPFFFASKHLGARSTARVYPNNRNRKESRSLETDAFARDTEPPSDSIQRLLSANLVLAGACPLLCKSASRLRQKVDNGGIAAQVYVVPTGCCRHPIVSVPNQPEIPAFVASVFTRREQRLNGLGEGEEARGDDSCRWIGMLSEQLAPKELASVR